MPFTNTQKQIRRLETLGGFFLPCACLAETGRKCLLVTEITKVGLNRL